MAGKHRNHPGLRPDSRLTPELIRAYTEGGLWRQRTLRSLLTEAAVRHPARVAAVSFSAEGRLSTAATLTYRDLDGAARKLAAGLQSLGVGPGDAVAVMLPNQIEFATAIFATFEVGAIYTGIPVSYGERETAAILRRGRAKCALLPAHHRGVDHLELFRQLRSDLPMLESLIVIGEADLGPNEHSYESLAGHSPDAATDHSTVDPAALAHVGFTSGTTGEPKGVMNTHQTLLAVLDGFVQHIGAESFGTPPMNLVASPIGHHTGFLWGVLLTTYLCGTAVYLDRWDPSHATAVIQERRVTVMFGAPTFFQDMLTLDEYHGHLPSLQTAVVAGAPVPRTLVDEVERAFGTWVCPAWGMTEWGIGISCQPAPDPRFRTTDGIAVERCEIRILDNEGHPAEPSSPGRLQIRGAGLFVGYLDRVDAMAESFDGDWFDTGDLASRDHEGFITLAGRAKDIVIRGGENIPVAEVESLLFDHPDLREVAVIGVPDQRLGERAVAVVVPRSSRAPTLEEITQFLLEKGVSKHFLPEGIVSLESLPRTASGKIRKVELREELGAFFAGSAR